MDKFEIPEFTRLSNSELRRMVSDLRLHRNMAQNLLIRAESELHIRRARIPKDGGVPTKR